MEWLENLWNTITDLVWYGEVREMMIASHDDDRALALDLAAGLREAAGVPVRVNDAENITGENRDGTKHEYPVEAGRIVIVSIRGPSWLRGGTVDVDTLRYQREV